jgi:hypothetical protein
MMEAVGAYEMSGCFNEIARRYIPKGVTSSYSTFLASHGFLLMLTGQL